MTKSRRLLPADYVEARPNVYGDVVCYSCGTSIMEYVKRNPESYIHASSNRCVADKPAVKYRCGDCYGVLYGGVSLRVTREGF